MENDKMCLNGVGVENWKMLLNGEGYIVFNGLV